MSSMDSKNLPTLSELLIPERIEMDYLASDWKAAVRRAGWLLWNTQVVRLEYIEAMVDTCLELGPYIVIAKGIALPHAAPEKGALQTGLSMLVLNPSIEFGNKDNDPVRLVFGLAALDHEIHVQALQTLAEIFIDESLRERLMHAKDKPEVLDVIHFVEKKND